MTRRRVFVTGMGVVSPVGNEVGSAFDAVCAGRPALEVLPATPDHPEEDAVVAPCTFDTDPVIPRIRARLMARAARMAVLAAADALDHAGLRDDPASEARGEAGVWIGSGLGGSEALVDSFGRWALQRRMRPAAVPLSMANGPASHISMHFGIRGPVQTHSIACVSSAVAIGEAFRAIRDGYLDRAVAGGAEAQLDRAVVTAWQGLGALAALHPDGPGASSRPFDADRTGLVLGEGAAILVLESEGAMRARGARPLAEVVGYGAASDAHDLTEPHADGQARAMRATLADAGLAPDRIGWLNAHATATLRGDEVECAAIREVFGRLADHLPVSSTKGVHGHLVGAAGALEAVWTVEALRTGRIPPTANLERVDPGCALGNLPVREARVGDLEWALSNSFAFGGSNAALVFRRVDPA